MKRLDPQDLSGLSAIPENGIIIHVGVFKTGTTAYQESLWRGRKGLAERNVLFHGPKSWLPKSLFKELRRQMRPDMPGTGDLFVKVQRSVNAHRGQVVVSSESLCLADDETAAELVKRLGRDRPVTVMITARSIAELLPSQWQQFLKRGLSTPLDEWLHEVLDDPRDPEHAFWQRYDFPSLVRRWGALVGEDNVVVVMTDKSDPGRTLRVTEALLGFPADAITLRQGARANASMTFTQAELLRATNALVRSDLSRTRYMDTMRLGAFAEKTRVESSDPDPIPMPKWASDLAGEEAEKQINQLEMSNAVVIGNLDELARPRFTEGELPTVPTQVSIDQAAANIAGAVLARDHQHAARKRAAGKNVEQPSLVRRLLAKVKRTS